jgi:2-amino-4-hydroxy-6-hydroxymethyldihydropteridine diphosphokinase
MAVVYLALGTNLGNRHANLHRAVNALDAVVRITAASSVYETEPWGVTEQPRFLNMVVQGETELAPEELLRKLKSIEGALGRVASVRYGPRLIDLDILFYDDLVYSSNELQIPHPSLMERRFVLVPLAEIAPELKHPVHQTTVRELLARLGDDGSVQLFSENRN